MIFHQHIENLDCLIWRDTGVFTHVVLAHHVHNATEQLL